MISSFWWKVGIYIGWYVFISFYNFSLHHLFETHSIPLVSFEGIGWNHSLGGSGVVDMDMKGDQNWDSLKTCKLIFSRFHYMKYNLEKEKMELFN